MNSNKFVIIERFRETWICTDFLYNVIFYIVFNSVTHAVGYCLRRSVYGKLLIHLNVLHFLSAVLWLAVYNGLFSIVLHSENFIVRVSFMYGFSKCWWIYACNNCYFHSKISKFLNCTSNCKSSILYTSRFWALTIK